MGGLGVSPQQAVAAADYSTKGEMYIPPLLAPGYSGGKTGEKRAMHCREMVGKIEGKERE